METGIVSGALFFVMILLLLVVYDSNTTLQRLVAKLWRHHPKSVAGKQGVTTSGGPQMATVEGGQNVTPEGQQINADGTLQEESTESTQEEISVPFDRLDQDEGQPKGVVEWYLWYLRKLFRKMFFWKNERVAAVATEEKTGNENRPKLGVLGWGRKQDDSVMIAVNTLRRAIDDLTGRVTWSETMLGKISQLEEGLTKVGEDTEIISEDMKDILGSIRSSIDGLESRLGQVASEVQEVKDRQVEIRENETDETEAADNEEVKKNVRRLEEAVADINDTLSSLPEKVRSAITSSENAVNNSREIGERVEIIANNLQSTLGYGVRKTFRCESCGSQGFVASQVVCSKCGTPSWWGWWPENGEAIAGAGVSTDSVEEDKIADANDAAEPIDSVNTPQVPEIDELIEAVGMADVPETPESTEELEMADEETETPTEK